MTTAQHIHNGRKCLPALEILAELHQCPANEALGDQAELLLRTSAQVSRERRHLTESDVRAGYLKLLIAALGYSAAHFFPEPHDFESKAIVDLAVKDGCSAVRRLRPDHVAQGLKKSRQEGPALNQRVQDVNLDPTIPIA